MTSEDGHAGTGTGTKAGGITWEAAREPCAGSQRGFLVKAAREGPAHARTVQSLLAAVLVLLLAAGTARAQEDIFTALTQAKAKPAAPVLIDRVLDPVCLGAPPDSLGAGGESPARCEFDVAIVLLQTAGERDAPAILHEAEAQWAHAGFRVAPWPRVKAALGRLGLIDSEALAPPDFERFARMISARYLVLLTVRESRTAKELGFGNTIAAAGRFIAVGAIFRVSHMNPWIVGAVAAGLLIGGVATTAYCDLGSQVFDSRVGKTVWVKTAKSTIKKVFLGLFAQKSMLAEKARHQAVERLYSSVLGELKPATKKPF